MDGWKLVNALHTGMTSQGPPETSPVSLVPCQTCLKAGVATLVDHSLTQMGTRWIEYDWTKTFFSGFDCHWRPDSRPKRFIVHDAY